MASPAQGLRRRGVDTVVFERAAAAGTAGYRLHLTYESLGRAARAAAGPPAAAIEGTAAGPETWRQIAVLDHRGRTRARIPLPDEHRLPIGRRPLRELLAPRRRHPVEHPGRLGAGARRPRGRCAGRTGGRGRGAGRGRPHPVPGHPAPDRAAGSRPSGLAAIGGTVFRPVRRPAA